MCSLSNLIELCQITTVSPTAPDIMGYDPLLSDVLKLFAELQDPRHHVCLQSAIQFKNVTAFASNPCMKLPTSHMTQTELVEMCT